MASTHEGISSIVESGDFVFDVDCFGADEKVGNDDDEERGEPLEFGGNKLPMKLPLTCWMKQLPMMPRNPTLPLG